jgi:hypothetical protein
VTDKPLDLSQLSPAEIRQASHGLRLLAPGELRTAADIRNITPAAWAAAAQQFLTGAAPVVPAAAVATTEEGESDE